MLITHYLNWPIFPISTSYALSIFDEDSRSFRISYSHINAGKIILVAINKVNIIFNWQKTGPIHTSFTAINSTQVLPYTVQI